MNAEIITIGDELLIGQTIDTNSAWIGRRFSDLGISITRRTAIQDRADAIKKAVDESFSRCDFVLMTGGLGPTKDDITKKTLAEYYQCGYRRDENVVNHLENIFKRRGRVLLEINLQQADLPEVCDTLFNENGTAPGMWFDANGKVLVSMPGVPNEMIGIMEKQVIPRIASRFNTRKILHRTALTINIPESMLSLKLEQFEASLPPHIKLAYLPSLNSVKLRLSCYDAESEDIVQDFNDYFNRMCSIADEYIFVRDDVDPARYMAQLLIRRNLRFSLAESCTAGFIANRMMMEPGVSSVMHGSIITYSNEIKHKELGVDNAVFSTVGAVSEECARQMADGVQQKFGSDIAISTTGIAGPGGATPEKAVGLIYIAVKIGNQPARVDKFQLFGNREQFMQRACNCAMLMLLQELNRHLS